MISKTSFGMTSEGKEAFLYTLKTENGMQVQVTNYGAALCSIKVKNLYGNYKEILLGYKNIYEYEIFMGIDKLWQVKNYDEYALTFEYDSSKNETDLDNQSLLKEEMTYVVNDNKICIVHSIRADKFFNDLLEKRVFLNLENSHNDNPIVNNHDGFGKTLVIDLKEAGIAIEIFTDLPDVRVYKNTFVNKQFDRQMKEKANSVGIDISHCLYLEMKQISDEINLSDLEICSSEDQKRICSVTIFKFVGLEI